MKDEQDIIRQSEEMTDTREPSFEVVLLRDGENPGLWRKGTGAANDRSSGNTVFHENFFILKRLYRQRELKGPEGAPVSLPVTCTHLIKGQAGDRKNFLI